MPRSWASGADAGRGFETSNLKAEPLVEGARVGQRPFDPGQLDGSVVK